MKKKIYLAGIISFCISLLAGCESKQSETTVATGTDALVLEEISSEDEIPETVSEVVNGEYGSAVIEAEVKLPEKYNTCSIVELETDFYDDQDIKDIATQIFDDGSYFLYMPYNNEQIAFLQGKLAELAPLATDPKEIRQFEDAQFMLEYNLVNLAEKHDEIDGEIKFYNVSEDGIGEEYTCNIFGTIDGINYFLSFTKSEEEYCFMELKKWRDVSHSYMDIGDECFDVKLSGNACTYSIEEAEELALEYVKGLGYEDFGVVRTYNAICGTTYDGETNIVEGYNVYLGRTYNSFNVPISYENYNEMYNLVYWDVTQNANQRRISEDIIEFVKVYVDSNGVNTVQINNPMKLTEVLSENTTMLSFDKVHDVAKDTMKTIVDEWQYTEYVDSIELGYDYVVEEGKIVLIPVWYYYSGEDQTSNYPFRWIFVEINAIDGTIVYSQISDLE